MERKAAKRHSVFPFVSNVFHRIRSKRFILFLHTLDWDLDSLLLLIYRDSGLGTRSAQARADIF